MFAAASLALRLVDRDVRNDINRTTRAELNPLWRSIVDLNATSDLDRRVLAKGTRVKAGNPVVLTAATSRKALSGGLIPNVSGARYEFGVGAKDKYRTYDRRNRTAPGSHKVTRRTLRQFPARTPKGRVIYPSFAEIAPRITSLWVQIVVRRIYEAHEKKG